MNNRRTCTHKDNYLCHDSLIAMHVLITTPCKSCMPLYIFGYCKVGFSVPCTTDHAMHHVHVIHLEQEFVTPINEAPFTPIQGYVVPTIRKCAWSILYTPICEQALHMHIYNTTYQCIFVVSYMHGFSEDTGRTNWVHSIGIYSGICEWWR